MACGRVGARCIAPAASAGWGRIGGIHRGEGGVPTRILYVADSLMAGGIESQLVELATGLDRARFAPHVLSLYGPTARDLHYAPDLRAAGVPLVAPDLGWGAADKLRGVAAIARAAWDVRPRIIQAEGYHANLLLRLATPLLPTAIRVGTVRGMHSRKQLAYEGLGAPLVSRIVVNAPHLADMLIRGARVPAGKIVHIPNGIATARYARPSDPALRARIAPGAGRVFVSLGRVSFEKNPHWIAEALGLLKRRGRLPEGPGGVRAFLVGPVQHAAARDALEAAIRRDGLEEGVVGRCPATPRPEDYYAACDASILCSPAEGLPNVAIESLAAGRPVLISAAANAAGVIADGVTGWVTRTGDVAGLADALDRVIHMPDAALAAMRAACLRRADDYSVEKMIARYTAFYEGLIPAAPTPRAGLAGARG